MKDHELAKLTNELTAIAIEYWPTQQLRQRISNKLQEYISKPISNDVDDAVSIPVSKKVKMRFGKPKRMEFPGGDEE